MQRITITIRSVYGEAKAYPMDYEAECFARIAGTKTLTRSTLLNILALGYDVVLVCGNGMPDGTVYRAGKCGLPIHLN
jgi:hypothetical protein